MKTLLKIIVIGVLISGCKNNKIDGPKKPDQLVSEEKMVEVLYDMAILSSAKGVNRKLLENKGVIPNDYVYKKHEIDSIQFAQSNAYYAHDIKKYQSIYSRVKLKLETDKSRFQIILDGEKSKRDSIAKGNRKRDSLRRLNNRRVSDSLKKINPNEYLLEKVGKPRQ
jgi:hypothetical protein